MPTTPKWQGIATFANAASISGTATGKVYPIAESIDAKGDPEVSERLPAGQPDTLDITRYGLNYSWGINGWQPSCFDMGYLLWHALGSQAYAAAKHTITPANTLPFLNLKVDRKTDLGSSTPTEEYVGCKVATVSIEQPLRTFARVSASGLAADQGALSAALSFTPDTDDDHVPLSWATLAAGFCKIGYAGAGSVQDSTVQGFKIDLQRNIGPAGYTIAAPAQPTAMLDGFRAITVEITREFTGTAALTEWNAWKSNLLVELDVKWVCGAWSCRINVPKIRITGSYAGEIGSGEDAIMATLVGKAVKPDGAPIMTVETVDDVLAVYT